MIFGWVSQQTTRNIGFSDWGLCIHVCVVVWWKWADHKFSQFCSDFFGNKGIFVQESGCGGADNTIFLINGQNLQNVRLHPCLAGVTDLHESVILGGICVGGLFCFGYDGWHIQCDFEVWESERERPRKDRHTERQTKDKLRQTREK